MLVGLINRTIHSYADSDYVLLLEEKRVWTRHQILHWQQVDLHIWTWWFSLFLTIFPVILMWKLIDRRRLLEIVVVGLLVTLLSTFMDELGCTFMLWEYPHKLLPVQVRLFPVDCVGLPVIYMLVYQYYHGWREYIKAWLVVSALLSFVGEPVYVWLNLYDPIAWHFYYSYPIYIAMAVAVRWLTGFMAAQDGKYGRAR